MAERSSVTAAAKPAVRSRAATWAAYTATAWALLFAAMSFYWAAGGTVGASTQSDIILKPAQAREPWFVALLWITGVLKVVAGLIALALVHQWGRWVPRWMLLAAAWAAGVGMVLYGGANLAVRGLMAVGLVATPEAMHSPAARWHLVLWDPWWLLGGILFVAAAWYATRRGRQPG
jgi:hypothetical protein